jgi:hypothetical protein
MGTFVQEVSLWNQGEELDPVLTFGSNIAVGDHIWVATSIHTDETPTISDNLGNSYSVIGSRVWDAGEGEGGMQWHATSAYAGACSITINFAAPSGFTKSYARTATGIASSGALDGYNGTAGNFASTATDGVSSGTFTPTTDNCMICGVYLHASAVTVTAGTSFTDRNTTNRVRAEDRNLATAGTVAATWTQSASSLGVALGAAFKPSSGTSIVPQAMAQYINQVIS